MCKVQHFLGQILVYLLHSEVFISLMQLCIGDEDENYTALYLYGKMLEQDCFLKRKPLKLPLLSEFISIENVKRFYVQAFSKQPSLT